jgi:hypothetical protein
MRVLLTPRRPLPSMQAVPQDAVVAGHGPGAIIPCALALRPSGNEKNARVEAALRKQSHPKWRSAIA